MSGGGVATFTTVNSGGTEFLLYSGFATFTTLNSGGTEFVLSEGQADSTTVDLGGAIDVASLLFTTGGSAGVDGSGLLTVSVGGVFDLQQLAGDYADEQFQLAKDAGNGTLVTAEARCYREEGSAYHDRPRRDRRELSIGDLVPTVLGDRSAGSPGSATANAPCARHTHPRKVWPVRIAAGRGVRPRRPAHRPVPLTRPRGLHQRRSIPIRHPINARTSSKSRWTTSLTTISNCRSTTWKPSASAVSWRAT